MKKSKVFLAIVIVIIIVSGAILLFSNDKCDKLSGNNYYAWGGKEAEKCRQAGCNVEIIKEVNDPETFDSGYEVFKCTK